MILAALKKLEYRGYDSAGVATLTDHKLCCKKDIGKLAEVELKHGLSALPGTAAIGHVRWATHGSVTKANAHPHLDCNQEIAVVHNGIIENYEDLRRRLEIRHRFVSETDTEVIPHLIEEHMAEGVPLERAVFEVTKELKGSYALVVISVKEPNKVVAARRDSPLVVGIADDGNFVASDVLSFLDTTNRAVLVAEGETVILTREKVLIFNSQFEKIERELCQVNWHWCDASKGRYNYFMLKEIREQPKALLHTLMQDKSLVMDIAMDVLRAKQVVFTACGTSRYAALIGRYVFSKLAGKFSDVVMASELQYFTDSIDKNTLVIAVSQSGETADVIEGVKRAKENGAKVLSLVNVVGSTLTRISDKVLHLNCGPEVSVAATKSFVSQLALFYTLAFAMANRFDEGMDKIRTLSCLIGANSINNNHELKRIARELRNNNDFYYIARGINFAIAGEGALKLKEIAYIHAEGMPAGELKHGTQP